MIPVRRDLSPKQGKVVDMKKNDLEVRKEDLIASALKGVCGTLPIVGPSIAEIIGYLIPKQRIDRIASFLKALESKIDPEARVKVEARMLEEKSVDLMEDGFLQAARALSEERIEHIASLLKNSLTSEDLERNAYKRLLFILGEINDVEVIILMAYSMHGVEQQDFWKKHRDIIIGESLRFPTSQEKVDQDAIHKTYRANLVRLDLLEIKAQQPSQSYEITSLGSLLLRSIDQGKKD